MQNTAASTTDTHKHSSQEHDQVAQQIIRKLTEFDRAVTESKFIEIDGLSIDNKPCAEVTKESRIKVINHMTKQAYEVGVDTIIRTPLANLITALETGIHIRVYNVTRIVGYYSRVQNWNSSKISELADRRKGNYWEGKRVNNEKVALLGE